MKETGRMKESAGFVTLKHPGKDPPEVQQIGYQDGPRCTEKVKPTLNNGDMPKYGRKD